MWSYTAIKGWASEFLRQFLLLHDRETIKKPDAPTSLGQVTIADVHSARTGEEHVKRVREWANSVWDAYAAQQDMARTWIGTALGGVDLRA